MSPARECGYYNMNKAPTGWAKKISAMANWSRTSHYYYTKPSKKGARLSVAAHIYKRTLTATFDNRIQSMVLTCYVA